MLENGRTALLCFAEPWVSERGESGVRIITSGPRYTRNKRADGFMSILAKVSGISREPTQKVAAPILLRLVALIIILQDGARSCHTVSHSLSMALQTLQDVMSEISPNMVTKETGSRRRC